MSKYLDLLVKWQTAQRLVGSTKPDRLTESAVLHSLAFLGALPLGVAKLADVGSGAGIPGIAIAIARPDIAVTLVESRQRRVSFLSAVVRELALGHVRVIGSRAERLGQEYVRTFDAVVMRCTGEVDELLPVAGRLVRHGGVVVVSAALSSASPPSAARVVVKSAREAWRWSFDTYAVA